MNDVPDERPEYDVEFKSCIRCNAGMPAHRVNDLCEECFAEEDGEEEEYDDE